MAFSKTLKERSLVIQCDSCFRDITLKPFIKCAECEWDQCLLCLPLGVETRAHKREHKYRLVSNMTAELLCPGWRVIDELLLLNGLISFGVGNFEDIASIIPEKTQEEARTHFLGIMGVPESREGETVFDTVPKSNPHDKHVLSYLPLRRDFESEVFANDCEHAIGHLQFAEGDSPFVRRHKESALDKYAALLRMRRIWKNFIIDRNLVRVQTIRERESGKDSALINKYKWLLQYLSKSDFNTFIGTLVQEARAMRSIEAQNRSAKIDTAKLSDVNNLIGPTEKELCKRLNMSVSLYADLKCLAVDCYVIVQPFKAVLERLFGQNEQERVEILYTWFKSQNIVHEPFH